MQSPGRHDVLATRQAGPPPRHSFSYAPSSPRTARRSSSAGGALQPSSTPPKPRETSGGAGDAGRGDTAARQTGHAAIAQHASSPADAAYPRTHRREPLARAAHSQSALVQGMPSGRREGLRRQTRAATVDKGKTSHLFCGNNALSPKLKQNGGTMVEGKPSECFRKGFGAGFHQHIPPERLEEFLADFSSPYRRLIEQPIYYGDGPVPEGLFRATLSQSRARGFGVGSMQLAKKILRERGGAGPNDTRR